MADHWATRWVNQAGDGQRLRLDPCHLPQNITYSAAETGKLLTCSLNERCILIRCGSRSQGDNIVQAVLPQHFRGIAARRVETADGQKAISLVLLHRTNADYSVPLLISCNHDDVLLDWRLWSDIYDLPMLLMDNNGNAGHVMQCSPLQRFTKNRTKKTPSQFLLRCRGRSLDMRLVIANQVMLG